MLKLYWGNEEDGWVFVGEYKTHKELTKATNNYLNKIAFKSYYYRGWQTEDGVNHIDYGSHWNFFKYTEE